MRKFWLVPPISLLISLVLILQMQLSFAQTSDPLRVLGELGQAYGNGNVDAALLLFADDAVLTEVPALTIKDVTTFTGKQQIRQWLQKNIDLRSAGTPQGPPTVTADKVTALERQESDFLKKAGVDFLLKNFEFVVSGSKIKSLKYTFTPESVEKLKQTGLLTTGNTTSPSQNQGGQKVPTGAPSSGLGGYASQENGSYWEIGVLLCLALTSLAGVIACNRRYWR